MRHACVIDWLLTCCYDPTRRSIEVVKHFCSWSGSSGYHFIVRPANCSILQFRHKRHMGRNLKYTVVRGWAPQPKTHTNLAYRNTAMCSGANPTRYQPPAHKNIQGWGINQGKNYTIACEDSYVRSSADAWDCLSEGDKFLFCRLFICRSLDRPAKSWDY